MQRASNQRLSIDGQRYEWTEVNMVNNIQKRDDHYDFR